MFEQLTPLTYWILTGLWLVILWLYLSYLKPSKIADKTVLVLLVILAIDAFRTLFESTYFGFYFTSLYGFLPKSIHDLLSQPEFVIIPKLLNIFAGLIVLFLLVRHWLPRELKKRKQDEDTLKLSASVFSHAREGIMITDSFGTIIEVNDMFSEITGYSRKEIVGQNPRILKSELHDEKFYSELWASLNNKGYWEGEIFNRRKNGELLPELLTISAVRDDHGEVLHYVGLFTDISNLKKQHEELELHRNQLQNLVDEQTLDLIRAKEKAEAANRSKSQFLASMSHEFRTPMHAILSFTNLGLKQVENKKVERYLENIRESGIRLTNLLNDLLDLSKLEAGKMEVDFIEQDLTTTIRNTIKEVDSLLMNKSISIQFNTEQSFDCMIDQKLMIQVMVNIFSNAIKFSPENSLINVDLQRFKAEIDDIHKDFIKVAVTDQGVGIPKDQLDIVFDEFTQSSETKNYVTGTGLGLPITKQIIELHNGKIWAESPPKGQMTGTVIYFQIPVYQLVD